MPSPISACHVSDYCCQGLKTCVVLLRAGCIFVRRAGVSEAVHAIPLGSGRLLGMPLKFWSWSQDQPSLEISVGATYDTEAYS